MVHHKYMCVRASHETCTRVVYSVKCLCVMKSQVLWPQKVLSHPICTHACIVAARRRLLQRHETSRKHRSHQGELAQITTIQMQGNSPVKYGQNSLQIGAYLLGNRVVLLNIRHHLLCHWPLLCNAHERSQSVAWSSAIRELVMAQHSHII